MKNHFLYSYAGNKRQEVEEIEKSINFEGITTIIEPFCGSSALSVFLAKKYPKRFKYILNDNDPFLIKLYNLMLDVELFKKFEEDINELCKTIVDKESYYKLTKNGTFEGEFISNKIYNFKQGMYKLNYIYKPIKFIDCEIVKFLRNNDVEILNMDAIDLYEQHYNEEETLIFLDPPYLNSHNEFYSNKKNTNIYEYLYNKPITDNKNNVVIVLERKWIIELLFQKFKFIEYGKIYQTNKKKTTHIIIRNKEK